MPVFRILLTANVSITLKVLRKYQKKTEALLKLNLYIIILLFLRVSGHKMVKGENIESKSNVQSLISKVYFSATVFISFSL